MGDLKSMRAEGLDISAMIAPRASGLICGLQGHLPWLGGPWEELKEKEPQTAIRDGFSRAFITIFDANITTLITALILYVIGTGPVKGFAITLSIGIVTSMFTAIVCTRAMVNLIYGNKNIKALKI